MFRCERGAASSGNLAASGSKASPKRIGVTDRSSKSLSSRSGFPPGCYVPPAPGVSPSFFVLVGDANRDRAVNALDFNVLATHYGTSGATTLDQGDFNFDGHVDSLDFDALAAGFGTRLPSPAPANVASFVRPDLFAVHPLNLAEEVLS